MRQIKRVLLDIIIAICLVIFYMFELYKSFPPPVQLVFIKMLLVSLGFIHAHITRKLCFPNVDWAVEGVNAKTITITALYVVFIYVYGLGG